MTKVVADASTNQDAVNNAIRGTYRYADQNQRSAGRSPACAGDGTKSSDAMPKEEPMTPQGATAVAPQADAQQPAEAAPVEQAAPAPASNGNSL